MKKYFFGALMAFIAFSSEGCSGSGTGKKFNVQDNTGGYVDLGLPSGTLWGANNANEAFYSFDQAVEWFGNCLPTADQIDELRSYCTWTWTGDGYKVVGLSGRYIFLPATGVSEKDGRVYNMGQVGAYWSRTACEAPDAVDLSIGPERAKIDCDDRCYRMSIRLVKK